MNGLTLPKDTETIKYLELQIEEVAATKKSWEQYDNKLPGAANAGVKHMIRLIGIRYSQLQRSYFALADTVYKVKG